MGLYFGMRGSIRRGECDRRSPVDPDPIRFRIVKMEQHGSYYIAMLHYPDCTTFDGNKVCVYYGFDPSKQKEIDPHFLNRNVSSPIARFPGDVVGMEHARWFVKTMNGGTNE